MHTRVWYAHQWQHISPYAELLPVAIAAVLLSGNVAA